MSNEEAQPALRLEGVSKTFRIRGSGELRAVSDVSLSIAEGETYALVGESGSGKSTLARLVVRILEPDRGHIVIDGTDVTHWSHAALRAVRQRLQFVVQDPYSSMNPRMTIGNVIAEPLRAHGMYKALGGTQRIEELLDAVGLPKRAMYRYPHEFSGGQRQRAAIARALALRPRLVVLDEAVSSLDVSMQGQILNLLRGIQRETGVAYLFITHDLSVVRHLASNVGVMHVGRIVECGPTETVFAAPAHPYTQALISAIPVINPDPSRRGRRIVLQGEAPSPVDPPSGCSFRTRCWAALELCSSEAPALSECGVGSRHYAACHLVGSEAISSGKR